MERPTGFDIVQRPRHYNAHPSGVECIEIIEHMTFNLGNAVKYLWRGGLKIDDPLQDYEKALWYVRREGERRPFRTFFTSAQIESFRMNMLAEQRARRVLARPSPWPEPVRQAVSHLIDFHCTGMLLENSRLIQQTENCIANAIAESACLGRALQP